MAGERGKIEMTKWEYRVEITEVTGLIHRNLEQITASWLNSFGQDGWELIDITTLSFSTGITQSAYQTFKRPLTPDA